MCVQVKQTELVALGRGGGRRHKAFHQDKSDYRLCHFGPLVPHALMGKDRGNTRNAGLIISN